MEFDLYNYLTYAIKLKGCNLTLNTNSRDLAFRYFNLYEKELSEAGLKIEDVQKPTKEFLTFVSTFTFPVIKL